MKIIKEIFNVFIWIFSVALQIAFGFIAGYTFFAEGYGNIIFMWIGITISVFLIGLISTLFRQTFTQKRYFLRLGLVAISVSFPLLFFYLFDFYYNADYEMFPIYPFLAAAAGIVGFYSLNWLSNKFPYKRLMNTIGYGVAALLITASLYSLWDWRTPISLPIQEIEPDQSLNMKLVNIVGDGFGADAMRGNYVYGNSDQRLVVLDISDPKHIFIAGQSDIISGDLLRVDLFGNYAYITSGNYGIDDKNEIHVVDISDPTQPRYLASYDLSGKYILDIKIFSNYLYIIGCIECTQDSRDQQALYIMDLANPSKPQEVGHYYSDTNITDVAVFGDYVYLALNEEGANRPGLNILDISNPNEPKEINSLFPSGKGYSLTISDGRLYFQGGTENFENGLYIMDISNPVLPKELSFQSYSDYDELTILPENIGYMTKSTPCPCNTSSDETPKTIVTFIDYSDPKKPKPHGAFEFEGYSVDVRGHTAFAWDSIIQAYRFFDISDIDKPIELGMYTPFSLHDVTGEIFVEGMKGVIPTDETNLYILDFSNPSLPTLSNIYDVGDYYSLIKLHKNHVYLRVADEIQVLDISDPTKPIIVWRYNAVGQSGRYVGMTIVEDYAYMIDEIGGLYIYNISNPANPALIRHQEDLKGFGYLDGFDAIGKHFYIFDDWKLHAFDSSDLTRISETDSLKTSVYQRVTIIGKFAFLDDSPFIGNEPATISIVDLSNPAKLKLVSSYHWLQWSNISGMSEKTVYIADWSDGLHILDFSDPKTPEEIGFYGTGDGAKGAASGSDNLFYVLSENDYALYILRYIPPTQ